MPNIIQFPTAATRGEAAITQALHQFDQGQRAEAIERMTHLILEERHDQAVQERAQHWLLDICDVRVEAERL